MKICGWVFIVIFNTFAGNFDYQLVNFSSAPIRTSAEILNETNIPLSKLSPFKCNLSQRFELFYDTHQINPHTDSLKIISKSNPNEIYTYKNESLYKKSSKINVQKQDEFVRAAFEALLVLEKIPVAKNLINKLQQSQTPFYIQSGRNQYNPTTLTGRTNLHGNDSLAIMNLDEKKPFVDGMPFSQIGFSGKINWSPNLEPELIESDFIARKAPSYISLGHELMHAYDGLRGLLDRRFVQSENLEFTELSEFRAVYFENQIRKSMGRLYRRYYSTPKTIKDSTRDMLDDQDQPILLPTPCINWL